MKFFTRIDLDWKLGSGFAIILILTGVTGIAGFNYVGQALLHINDEEKQLANIIGDLKTTTQLNESITAARVAITEMSQMSATADIDQLEKKFNEESARIDELVESLLGTAAADETDTPTTVDSGARATVEQLAAVHQQLQSTSLTISALSRMLTERVATADAAMVKVDASSSETDGLLDSIGHFAAAGLATVRQDGPGTADAASCWSTQKVGAAFPSGP